MTSTPSTPSTPSSQTNLASWLPVGAAAGLLAGVIAVGALGGGDDSGGTVASDTALGSTTLAVESTTTAAPVTYDAVEESADTVAKIPLTQSLGSGFTGDEVQMVQERLAELGFDPGPVDGVFGGLTRQAVWAFEKLIMETPRSEATGIVTPDMWDRMQDPIQVAPRRPTGAGSDHVEIYLPEQVMAIFHGGEPVLVAHVSTGELAPGATGFTPWQEMADEYCETITIDTDENGDLLEEPIEKAICGRSYTPPGAFTAYKKIEGRRLSALGGMYDPIYINQGIAIHGANEIPLYPASHGCIRVSRTLGEKLQSLIDIGDDVLIWDGVTEPWNQPDSARQMRFDYPDPNATTTTTSTTSTTVESTTTTTVAPTTTVPTATTDAPATTEAPNTTTTVPPNVTTTTPPTSAPPAP